MNANSDHPRCGTVTDTGTGNFRLFLVHGATAASCVVCTSTFAGFLGRWNWVLELFSHFRLHYALILMAALVVLALERRWKTVAAVGCFAAINVVCIAPIYVDPPNGRTVGVGLRVVLWNVHTTNDEHASVIEFLKRIDADVVLLLEIDDAWLFDVREQLDDYPYFTAVPRDDNFGIGLFSKQPIVGGTEPMGAVALPAVRVKVTKEGRALTLIGVHALPPKNGEYASYRNDIFDSLAHLVPQLDGPVVVLGDLNAAPWSPHFHDLLEGTGLSDGRCGFGIKATWPSSLGPLGIPIDHCLVSGDVVVRNFQVGPSAGSDHRAVVVDLVLGATDGG